MKKQVSLIFAAFVLLTGCGNDVETGGVKDGRVPLQVISDIQTRAGNNTWDKNDAIGICMLATGTTTVAENSENRLYTTAEGDGKFTAADRQTIYFPINGSPVDFTAYYPYTTPLIEGALAWDVSTQTHLKAIDLMTAKAVSTQDKPLDKDHSTVALNFTHCLTKLELIIRNGKGIAASELAGMTVQITNQRTTGFYKPRLNAFGMNASGMNAKPVATVTLNTVSEGTLAQAILLPTTTSEGLNPIVPGRKLIFTFKTGETFEWAVPEDKAFNAAEKNLYRITINRIGLEVTSIITDWTAGNGDGGESGDAE
ncbi:MAG: fimbrillin family protein [Bacteroides sp.]